MIKTKSLRLRRLEESHRKDSISSEKLLPKLNTQGDIMVTLEYKINKKNEVTFKLVAGKVNTRIKRNLKEFLQIEDYLIRYLDCKMPELRSILPPIEKARMSNSSLDHMYIYESRLRSIDRFLQVIADTPELWTRDILIFLGIDKGADQAVYLQKRNELLQRKHKGLMYSQEEGKHNRFDLPMEDFSEPSHR